MNSEKFLANLREMPLIAILRGLRPDDAIEVVEVLLAQGIKIVEVPLNSPDPFSSIEKIANRFSGQLTVGAGTVLTEQDVEKVCAAGGEIALSPCVNSAVIRRALELGLEPVPGIATPTEAITALDAGARVLKVFPAESLGPNFFRHLPAVLPAHCQLLAVGGIDLTNIRQFLAAGAAGVGLGSSLFRPEMDKRIMRQNAARFVELYRPVR